MALLSCKNKWARVSSCPSRHVLRRLRELGRLRKNLTLSRCSFSALKVWVLIRKFRDKESLNPLVFQRLNRNIRRLNERTTEDRRAKKAARFRQYRRVFLDFLRR